MGLRRQARECALQLLFQHDLGQHHFAGGQTTAATGGKPKPAVEMEPVVTIPPEVKPFVEELVNGVLNRLPELDAMLQRFTEHWSIDRMAVVDRNVLRCALYELLYVDQVPAKVTINEAIEIAKRYGSEESGAFINGILDRIMKAEERLEPKRMASA
jgi:N utilization substance protein B